MTAPPSEVGFQLETDARGRLVLIDAEGQRHEGITPVRAFPLQAPEEGISLVGSDGHERVWIDRLADLPEATRRQIERALGDRELVPVIQRIVEVSTFSTPSVWTLDTDRGRARLVLKGEEDIRRLPNGDLLVADTHGLQFLLKNPAGVDRQTKRLLERFL
jgi:hypothetical protein